MRTRTCGSRSRIHGRRDDPRPCRPMFTRRSKAQKHEVLSIRNNAALNSILGSVRAATGDARDDGCAGCLSCGPLTTTRLATRTKKNWSNASTRSLLMSLEENEAMRIESVVIENINSLSGRFEIDFTDGAVFRRPVCDRRPVGFAGKPQCSTPSALRCTARRRASMRSAKRRTRSCPSDQDECSAGVPFSGRAGNGIKAHFPISAQRGSKAVPFR